MTEVYTQRSLPHWYVPGAVHFITFRLAGTIPSDVLRDLRAERNRALGEARKGGPDAPARRRRVREEFFRRYEGYLDRHRDVAYLAEPQIAALVRRSLFYQHKRTCGLIAYCIMPNHVHMLVQPFDADPDECVDGRSTASPELAVGRRWEDCAAIDERPDAQSPLARIMRNLKSYTAHEANRVLGRSGAFWQAESYDHWLREHESLDAVVDYIRLNPVEAGLATEPHGWYWSSAHDRYVHDGTLSGLVALPE